MRKYLSVEVEHTRHARFLPLDQPGENKISLTTLADFQKRAEVKIFLIGEDQRILLHEFEVEGLPKKQAGEPRLVLKGTYDGKGNVRLSLSVDGRHYSSTSLSVKKYTRKRVWWPWILLIALLLLGASAWLLLRSCNSTGLFRDASGPSPAPTTAAEGPDESQPGGKSKSESDRGGSTGSQAEVSPEPAPQATAEKEPAATDTEPAAETEPEAQAEIVVESDEAESAAQAQEEEQTSEAQPRAAAAVDLSEQVYFGPDSSELSPEARRTLAAFAEELESYDQPRLRIEGHCALYGTEQGREELSYDRAQRVFQYFRELGYSFEEEPQVRGRGGEEPVTRESDQQYLNRRVEITTIRPDNNNSGRQDR